MLKNIIELSFPGDKSVSHRLILLSLITDKEIQISNLPSSKDVLTSLNIVKNLGVEVICHEKDGETLYTFYGLKEKTFDKELTLDCGNSATTARLLCGILSNLKGKFKLIGDSSLSKRPMERVVKPLAELMEVKIKSTQGHLPIYIDSSGKTKSTDFYNETNSAQVKSAILFAGLASNNFTTVKEKIISRDHTERLLKYISQHQKDESLIFNIPGDISSAAYFAVLASITDKPIKLSKVLLNPTRTGFINVLKRMGIKIHQKIIEDEWEQVGDLIIEGGNLKATDITPDEIPSLIDELPALSIAMAFAEGKSTISGASELRIKESDRISCLISQLQKAGVHCEEKPDGYEITGPSIIKTAKLNSFNDHRLAMSFAILGYCSNTTIDIVNRESVNISFPEFYEYLDKSWKGWKS